jgi:hypothetical protein
LRLCHGCSLPEHWGCVSFPYVPHAAVVRELTPSYDILSGLSQKRYLSTWSLLDRTCAWLSNRSLRCTLYEFVSLVAYSWWIRVNVVVVASWRFYQLVHMLIKYN